MSNFLLKPVSASVQRIDLDRAQVGGCMRTEDGKWAGTITYHGHKAKVTGFATAANAFHAACALVGDMAFTAAHPACTFQGTAQGTGDEAAEKRVLDFAMQDRVAARNKVPGCAYRIVTSRRRR